MKQVNMNAYTEMVQIVIEWLTLNVLYTCMA